MNTFVILLLFVLLILISLLVSELVKQSKEIDALHISLDDASRDIQRLKDGVDRQPLRSSKRSRDIDNNAARFEARRYIDTMDPTYYRSVIFNEQAHIIVPKDLMLAGDKESACEVCTLSALCKEATRKQGGDIRLCEVISGKEDQMFTTLKYYSQLRSQGGRGV